MSNAGMHGSRYWNDDEGWEYEYAFLVPPDTIDGNYTGKIHNVLKKFDKTLYVRSKNSPSDGWEKVQNTEEMPELETNRGKNGWTLSSDRYILSDNGVLNELEKNLKEAGYSCSFMVINDEPEKEIEGNSEVDLEAEDSEQPSLDETTHESDNVKEKSEKKSKKKKQKSKKSTKVKVGNGPQSKTIRKLKDKKKSAAASKDRGLIPYKVISNNNNNDADVKNAWTTIGNFIKTNAKTYKDVKPVGYGDKKHWHSWHKSWVEKVFVQGDQARFWLMKLNEDLKDKLGNDLTKFGFTIEPYEDGNSKSVTPTISTEPEPENPEVEPMKKPEETPKPPDAHKTSEGTQKPPVRPLTKTPNKEREVEKKSPQINDQKEREEEKKIPGKSTSSNSPPDKETVSGNAYLQDIHSVINLRKTPTKPKQQIDANRENDLTSMLRKVMKVRRADIADDEEPVEGDKNHEIMNVLTKQKPGIYVAMLQLTVPYKEIKKNLSRTALCPSGSGKMWLTDKEDGKYEDKRNITNKIDENTLEECAITGKDGPQGWYVRVITEIESDEWEDDGDEKNFLPSETQMNALLAMQNDVSTKGARLVNISTPFPELKALVKNPPTLPKRNMKAGPVPSGFATLDSFKPKPNNRNVKTLVLVKYDNIRTAKELGMDFRTKLSKSTRKYGAFDVNKANKTLSDFKNGTLIGTRGMRADKNYRTVLENPVYDNYKANAGSYVVALWNLEIPADTSEDEIKTLRDELAKCGIAIRKDWRKK